MVPLIKFFESAIKGDRTTSYALVGNIINNWPAFVSAVNESYTLPIAPSVKDAFVKKLVLQRAFEVLGQRFTDISSLTMSGPDDLVNPGVRDYAMLFGEHMKSLVNVSTKAGDYTFYNKYLFVFDQKALAKHMSRKGLTAGNIDYRHLFEIMPSDIQGVLALSEYTIISKQQLDSITGGGYMAPHVMTTFDTKISLEGKSAGKNAWHKALKNSGTNYKHFMNEHMTDDDVSTVLDSLTFESQFVDKLKEIISTDKLKIMNRDTIVQDLWISLTKDSNHILDTIRQISFNKTLDMHKSNVCITEGSVQVNYPYLDFESGAPVALRFLRKASPIVTTLNSFKLLAGVAYYDNTYKSSLAVADKVYTANETLSLEEFKILSHTTLSYRFGLDRLAVKKVHEDFKLGVVYTGATVADIMTQSSFLPEVVFNDNQIVMMRQTRTEESDVTNIPLFYSRYSFSWHAKCSDDQQPLVDDEYLEAGRYKFEFIYNHQQDSMIPNLLNQLVDSVINSKHVKIRPPLSNGTQTYQVLPKKTTFPDFIYSRSLTGHKIDFNRYKFWMSLLEREYDIDNFQDSLVVADNYKLFLDIYTDQVLESLKLMTSATDLGALYRVLNGETTIQKIMYRSSLGLLREMASRLSSRETYLVFSRLFDELSRDKTVMAGAAALDKPMSDRLDGDLSIVDTYVKEASPVDGENGGN